MYQNQNSILPNLTRLDKDMFEQKTSLCVLHPTTSNFKISTGCGIFLRQRESNIVYQQKKLTQIYGSDNNKNLFTIYIFASVKPDLLPLSTGT